MSMKKGLVITIDAVVALVEILGIGFLVWKWIEPTNFGYAVLFVCVWIVVAWIIATLTDKLLSPLNKVLDEEKVVERCEDIEKEISFEETEKLERFKDALEKVMQASEEEDKTKYQQATIDLYNETMKNLFSFINNLERFRWDIASPYENRFLSEQDAWEVARNTPNPFLSSIPFRLRNPYSDNAFLDELDVTPIKELKEFIDKHRELAQSLIEWGIKYGITTQDTCDRMDERNYTTSCIMGTEFSPPIRDKRWDDLASKEPDNIKSVNVSKETLNVYNDKYELIGYIDNKPTSTSSTYYDLNGKLVENNEIYYLFLNEHPNTHEEVCIRCDIPKCKMNPTYADFKDDE